jgi:AcrR family transcriptional regulator
MLSTIHEQKKKKRELLINSASELFLEKGADGTAIDDIVRKAGVAKGTFYLYFRDRNELLHNIVAGKSADVLREAFQKAANRSPANDTEKILYAVEEIIARFTRDPRLLSLIYKNLSWGMVSKMTRADGSGGLDLGFGRLAEGDTRREFEKKAFIIVELVSSVTYSSIVLGEPCGIGEMKPFILNSVRKLLS